MLLLFLLTHVLSVLSQAPPSPPQNVHVDQWHLTWSPAPGEEDVRFVVRYHSFDSSSDEETWKVVPACDQTPLYFCNVSFTEAQANHGCVKLLVEAQRSGLTSTPGQACSIHGGSCTPAVSLTARPGSLTIHLMEDHSLFLEYAAHAAHMIYFGKEGEPLQKHAQSASSWTIDKLEAGQNYCAKVEYVIFNKSVGLPSCVQCVRIPEPDSAHSVTVTAVVVLVLLLVVVVPVTAYILIFHHGQIKRWLRPPCQIPPDLLRLDQQRGVLLPLYSPSEELCDLVSSITPAEEAQQ